MSFFKLNGGVGVALAALAMLVGSSQVARADPTTLVCTNDSAPHFPQVTVELDEAKDTATINYDASSPQPAYSEGPLAATFDSKTVTFDFNDKNGSGGEGMYSHHTINRVTLVLLSYKSVKAPWEQALPGDKLVWHYSCHLGKAQF